MSTIRNPVGPQPPQVYWRRRIMVGLGLVAIIVVIVLIIVRPGSGNEGTPAADVAASPSASADASAEDDEESTDDGMCRTENLTIEAITDSDAYAAGVNPQIGMRLTNVGTTPCILDVTPSRQVYEIGSGDETYWLSSDCQQEAAEAMVTLEPNEPQSTTLIPWDRTRSAPCDNSTQPVPAGDATYHLQVRLGEDLESARKTFRLL
ncbi:hypothetical protein OH146_06340 [Salinibacterium sp. SYSU T00001]|uniref:hypothetical protein n=1 Tax=Homoserinimonas sedimenticola TaxID=2986805 RepID=UPI002235A27D|nr:hypothetical protein [Salinibacterium sedimenticola]MCW4385390.1 hypothetical protein [Salinibacterium sedimenticola]